MLVLEKNEHKPTMLALFAQLQLELIAEQATGENLLLEVVVSAFFYGAAEKLNNQAGGDSTKARRQLADIIVLCCQIPQSSAMCMVDSLCVLIEKNLLVENISQQGADAADQWLACDTSGDDKLARLVKQYRGKTLREFGIEGISTRYEAQQKLLYLGVDDSVERVQRRSKMLLFIIYFMVIIFISYICKEVYFH